MIDNFSLVSIKNASIQFLKDPGTNDGKFGCMGTLEAETEIQEKTKNCEGTIETITIPQYMTVTVEGHIKRSVLREVFGMTDEDLKPGIHSYGIKSKGARFIFTADVIDEFEDIKQLIAFPKGSSSTGLSITVDNEADETPYMELEFRANADEQGNFYYEAFEEELDQEVKDAWHTDFNYELVKETEV